MSVEFKWVAIDGIWNRFTREKRDEWRCVLVLRRAVFFASKIVNWECLDMGFICLLFTDMRGENGHANGLE